MKKSLKWILAVLLCPPMLFLLLAALLYVPPIQNWAVQKAAYIASQKTGMQITIGRIDLKFPLDLNLQKFRAIHEGDTIADVGSLVADVQLWPLLKKKVVVNGLELNQAKLNTNGFISDLRIKGRIEHFSVSSRGIDLDKQTATVNDATLDNATLDIALSDTAAVDTTSTPIAWKILADNININNTKLSVHLPGDTLSIGADFSHAVTRNGYMDLGSEHYAVESLEWNGGKLTYDNQQEEKSEGFDYNHIALTDISLAVDSIEYSPKNARLTVRQAAMKEQSGLEITTLTGKLQTDYNRVGLSDFVLKTKDSDIMAEADADFSVADSINPGKMKLRLNAQIGKQDLMRFAGGMPQGFIKKYPNQPLAIKGSVNGNLQRMEFTGLDVSLPSAFHLTANGFVANVTDPEQLRAQVAVKAETNDLGFITALPQLSDLNAQLAIPKGMSLNGEVKANGNAYTADLTARQGSGVVKLKGNYNGTTESYDADISVRNLNLHNFLPKDSIYTITADIKAQGRGTDFFKNNSHLTANASVSQLQYGHWNLNNLHADATLKNGRAVATVIGHNELLEGTINVNALLSSKQIDATVDADLQMADLYRMRLADSPLAIGLCGQIKVSSDMKQSHHVKGLLSDLYIKDQQATYRPENVGLLLNTTRDTTWLRMQSGDFIVKMDANGGYERLLSQFTAIGDSMKSQYQNKVIDQPVIKRMLPTMRLYATSGRNNPIANILRSRDIDFKDLLVDINTSPETGINGQAHLYSLNYDSIRIDTITLNLVQKGERLTYHGQVRNNKRNPQFVFNALLDGHIHDKGAVVGLRYYDDKGKMGVRLGATADMVADGINIRLLPERPTIGYKEFTLNKDNFILLGKGNKIQAKVDLIADDKTGVKVYTEDQDSTMLQDLTVSLNRLNLDEVTSVLPYLPRMSGLLGGDFHIVQDQQEKFSVVSDLTVHQMAYEGSPIGNLGTELLYLQKEDDTHAIEARLMLDDEEFGLLSGSYRAATPSPQTGKKGDGEIDATFTMTRLPLSLVNGFVPDQIVGLDGYAEGELTIKGPTSHPQINGEAYLDSAYLVSLPYSVRMRFDNDPVRIVGSQLLLENFGLYAYNDQPCNLMGNIDFSDLDRITMDLRMRAQNLQIIDAKQTAKSVAFGKAFINFFARLQGPLDALNMRGRLDVLGSTDMTYLLLDSPLSTDNRLDELVKFTDFSDTTQTIVTRPTPSGLNADLNISVSQGAHIVCDLNAEQTNYIDLMGGGDLRMKYNAEGISLTGRYTLSNGEMKYSLPVIPLKTFTIQNGSYVEFTGDPMNPRLNITATERTKASVGTEGTQSRSVSFDCGVVITKTLNDMGLEFVISAPEDMSVNNELLAMSTEERGKIAVTMLTTGMYLADGNTSGFSMNSALSSFLQSEINSITGSALKTLDLSVGLDNTTDASGYMHTDYSFKFAKRLWNNRLKIELGGKVSTGSDMPGQQQSFFDNVNMEYRLDQNGQKNMKLFYKQNVYDWLDGYTGEYGAGFVWRRKLDTLWDVFRSTPSQGNMLRMPNSRPPQASDTIRAEKTNDTIRTERTQ